MIDPPTATALLCARLKKNQCLSFMFFSRYARLLIVSIRQLVYRHGLHRMQRLPRRAVVPPGDRGTATNQLLEAEFFAHVRADAVHADGA